MSASPNDPTRATPRFAALDALRGLAVLMVVYDHLFAVAGERYAGAAFAPTALVREHITGPLGIIQDFGWLGVCLFFLISGFVILHAARSESMGTFIVRRVFRIWPPLAVAVLIVAVLDMVTGTLRPWTDYLLGLSLYGYLNVPQVVVLGVAWTLIIEVIFYALVALAIPLLHTRAVALGVALIGVVPALSCFYARDFGAEFFLLAASCAYLPVLLMGSVIYLMRQSLCPRPLALALFVGNWAVFTWGVQTIHTPFQALNNSYVLSLVYALCIFVLCMERSLPRFLHFTGRISYSVYLLHGTVGFALVHVLAPYTGAALGVPWLATAVVIGASWLMWRWVERPSTDLGRRLLRVAGAGGTVSHPMSTQPLPVTAQPAAPGQPTP